jgi:hypothetical protein
MSTALPPDRCGNCDALLAGPYCHQCGQRDVDHLASVREFFRHLAESLLGYDSRLLRTARALFTRPGFLTAEYIAGRRARYASPLQTYLVAAALLFASGAWRPIVTFDPVTRDFRSGMATIGVYNRLSDEDVSTIREHGMSLELFGERFANATTSHLSTFLVLIVPVFALLIAVTFLGSRRPFAHHILFALHWSAFYLTVLALLQLLPRRLFMNPVALLVIFGWPLLYFMLAVRRAYVTGWPATLLRGVALFLMYQVLLVVWLNLITTYTRHHL